MPSTDRLSSTFTQTSTPIAAQAHSALNVRLHYFDADPRNDIRNTQSINTVVKDGRVFDRIALDELLNDLEVKGRRQAKGLDQ